MEIVKFMQFELLFPTWENFSAIYDQTGIL